MIPNPVTQDHTHEIKVLRARLEAAETLVERYALCPTGVCIVCQAEERTARNMRDKQ